MATSAGTRMVVVTCVVAIAVVVAGVVAGAAAAVVVGDTIMIYYRSENGNLHREHAPAIDLPHLKQYWWEGRLHNAHGPAVETSGGTRMYYWRGLHVEASVWHGMATMSAAEILQVGNAELRRCIVERLGPQALLKAAQLLDESLAPEMPRPNRLYRVEVAGDEPLVFLELVNSTAEPTGQHKLYYVRVPPTLTTVKAALAWTLDITGDYKFVYES